MDKPAFSFANVQNRTAVADGGRPAVSALAGRVASLCEALAAHAVRPSLYRQGAQYLTTGVTARVAMGRLAETQGDGWSTKGAASATPEYGLSVVYSALRAQIPVTVTVLDPAGHASQDSLQRFRLQFSEFLEHANVERRLLGLCLAASELPSPQVRAELRLSLGAGPRYVMLHDLLEAPRQQSVCRQDIWQVLRIEENGLPRFWPAFAAGVRSQCPLLTSEISSTVQPGNGLVAPAGTAWLPLTLDLCEFADARGQMDYPRLDAALDASVELGDRLIDCISWFDDRQRRDAAMNRRLAVSIEGLGDLAERSGSRPEELASLRRFDRLLVRVRRRLWSASRRLAGSRGPLPALLAQESLPTGDDGAGRHDWHRRWQAALAKGQVRNRNLLALSPYALMPRTGKPDPAFADLLPLLAHADALYFADPPSLNHWNLKDFIDFHRRLGAQVRRHNAASFVAAGV